MPFLAAFAVSALVAAAAWSARALTPGGAVAASAIGAAILSGTGWSGALVLLAFFLPSTLVGRLTPVRSTVSDAKGEQRDAVQVLANGWAAALGAVVGLAPPELRLWIVTAALAAAAADTWATAIGTLSASDPRHLLSHHPVPPGTSGGVSLIGSLGGAAGGLLVSAAGFAAGGGVSLLLAGTALGFGGMLLDSLLGAAMQGRFRCPDCRVPSERPRHRCGATTDLVGGWRWLDNDAVNAITTGLTATAGGLVWWWLS